MDKIKIGCGYWQTGYGKGFKKKANIYLINNKLYARDKARYHHVISDLENFIPVNVMGNFKTFVQVWPNEHISYSMIDLYELLGSPKQN